MKTFKMTQKGFTLIELMIVVAIIGILAAIAIPKFAQMLEKAREGSTKGNAGTIRSALAIYYGDREGVWPTTLNNNTGMWKSYLMSVYLDDLPEVKVTHSGVYSASQVDNPTGGAVSYLSADAVPAAKLRGWAYDATYGKIYVNSNYTDTRNVSYTTY